MATSGFGMRILQGSGEGRSFESYESLHKFVNRNGTKHAREYLNVVNSLASGGAGADIVVQSDTTATTDKAAGGATLVLASDTNDNAYDGQTVTVYYISSTDGSSKACRATFNAADSTTEVAFTDLATGLVPVTDFECFDVKNYGPVSGAATYSSAVYCSVAVQAGDNVCIGITGLVAGIADPDICYAHINATKQYPLITDCYGVGNVFGARESDAAGDDDNTQTLVYLTKWGEEKTATQANTATHTDIIQYVDADGDYVNDFYRVRTLESDGLLTKAHHLCDWDNATQYAVIEAVQSQMSNTNYMALGSAYGESYIGEIVCGWSIITDTVTVTVIFQPYGSPYLQIMKRTLGGAGKGPASEVIPINMRLEPCSVVQIQIADGAVASGLFNCSAYMLDYV